MTAFNASKIIPGHGPLSTREDLRAYRDALKSMRDAVADHMADGMSLGVTEVVSSLETEVAPRDLEVAAGVVKAGTVAGTYTPPGN